MNTDVLIKLSNILNSRLGGLTIEDINLGVINSLRNEMIGHEYIFDAIIPSLHEGLNSSGISEVYFEGSTNIFDYPEYNDILKARDFFSLLDDKANMNTLLKAGNGIRIAIGKENFIEEAKECSIISTEYSIGNIPLGTIGIIGPTRIPYSKLITVISKVVKELNESLSQIYYDDRW